MVRFAVAIFCTLVIGNSLGCGTNTAQLPPTAPVTGTVTLDGRPMATGEVVFTVPGEPEQRIQVADGAYTGNAYIGQNNVGVFTYREEAPTSGLSTDTINKVNLVAAQYSYNTTLTADVTADGPNEFKFEARTK